MKKNLILLIGMVICHLAFSQKSIFVLHPNVGDTIDLKEKADYLLFQEIKGSDFKFAFITNSTEGNLLNICSGDDSVFVRNIDALEISKLRENILKLTEYYSNEAKSDSIRRNQKLSLDFSGPPNPNQINSKMVRNDDIDKILDEVRQTNRLKGDAERQKIIEDGNDLTGSNARIEFLNFKRKKKN